MVSKSFAELLNNLTDMRPSEKTTAGPILFYKDHPVRLHSGELEGIHWMDIHIELPRFSVQQLTSAQKVLKANLEMGAATPIPTWFGANDKGNLVFINRLDWQQLSAEVLDQHIERCINQMTEALVGEGV